MNSKSPSPAKSLPQKINLLGKYCRLEPLLESIHGESLWKNAGSHDDLWIYMMDGPFNTEEEFRTWLKTRENNNIRHYYTIIDLKSGEPLGALCLMDCNLEHATCELGGIFFSPKLQRTRIATEAIYLLSNHAFTLGYRRLQWKCNVKNEASHRAVLRFGFIFEGILKNHMILKGQNRDKAFFSIIDNNWPTHKSSFEQWLNEENFNKEGQQKQRLEDFR
jgi:RimJ/RimL family protein N-acetyltransferase